MCDRQHPSHSSDSASLACMNVSGVELEYGRVPLPSERCLRDVQAQPARHCRFLLNMHPNVAQQKVKLISADGHLFSEAALDLPIAEVFG